jgi:sentrin-specific protease 8
MDTEVPDDRDDVCFVSPSAVFLCTGPCGMTPEIITQEFKPLKLSNKNIILLPINDHQSRDHAGGQHWALLVYARHTNAFVFYDSLSGKNKQMAQKAVEFLSGAIACKDGESVLTFLL